MAHVQCNASGAVVGVFANAQDGISVEIDDGDLRLAAFRAAQDAPRIADECQRRIYAVASQNCQMNMTAWIASGQAGADDKAAFDAALAWVQAMRAACARFVAAGGPDSGGDWPECPPQAAALAARF